MRGVAHWRYCVDFVPGYWRERSLIFLILFAGLIHDFSQADVNVGWFTANPAVPLVLLVIGYLLMLGHRLGSRGEEEG